MTQFFIFGASIAQGVGAERAGWADLLKQSLATKMYSKNGVGEKYELYNFAKPGAQAEFVIATHGDQLKFYRESGKVVAIVCVGGNNVKAQGAPDNFVSTVEEYEQLMEQLLGKLKQSVDELIVLPSVVAVDESKTNPKANPITGGQSYFSNDRISLFNHALVKLCDQLGVKYVDIEITPQEWAEKFLYDDGLHPNQAGHQYIFEKLAAVTDKLL